VQTFKKDVRFISKVTMLIENEMSQLITEKITDFLNNAAIKLN
jgi:hypothetical protein